MTIEQLITELKMYPKETEVYSFNDERQIFEAVTWVGNKKGYINRDASNFHIGTITHLWNSCPSDQTVQLVCLSDRDID